MLNKNIIFTELLWRLFRLLSRSPDDKINVIIGDGDDHVGHVVRRVQMAFHGGPEETERRMSGCALISEKVFWRCFDENRSDTFVLVAAHSSVVLNAGEHGYCLNLAFWGFKME